MTDDSEPNYFENPYADVNFETGRKFATPDGTAELRSIARINPSSGSGEYYIGGESYWEYKVLLIVDDRVRITQMKQEEIKEKLDSGEWTRPAGQASLDDY